VIEESNARRAQWLVSEEQNGARSVTGYLPLTHSTAFHSLKAYPMLHYKARLIALLCVVLRATNHYSPL
jgi:hypothetical protein